MKGPQKSRVRRFILDYGRIDDIPKSKALYRQLLKYHWEYYSEVAFQRAQIYDALKSAIRERATSQFRFEKWQRAVKYRYSLEPLGTKGSLIDPGGRFNIGTIDPSRFAVFPALYMGYDKDTVLDELFARDKKGDLLTPEELALSRTASVTIVSVSGILESVFDLRDQGNLADIVDLVKNFHLSPALINEAKRLGQSPPKLVHSLGQVMKTLLDPNWRFFPMQWDVPANPQIFGQMVMDAGLDGIVYPSVLTGKTCLAVYPQNFTSSASFVEIDDPVPADIVRKRIDATTFKDFL